MNSGGTSGNGTVFRVNTDGTGFTKIHDFQGNAGREPGFLQMVEGPRFEALRQDDIRRSLGLGNALRI
jgi:uncharacterized repeat protein (TIGR03803 family)